MKESNSAGIHDTPDALSHQQRDDSRILEQALEQGLPRRFSIGCVWSTCSNTTNSIEQEAALLEAILAELLTA